LDSAVAESARPVLVVCRTVIGKGAPNRQGTEKVHGSPLGPEETKLTKSAYGWPQEPTFLVPREVRERFDDLAAARRDERARWDHASTKWRSARPDDFARWEGLRRDRTPSARDLLDRTIAGWNPGAKATRQHSQAVIQKMAAALPHLVGGSA